MRPIYTVIIAVILGTVAIAGCSSSPRDTSPVALLMPPPIQDSNSDGFWNTIDANLTELNVDALEDHIRLCRDTGATAQIVVYKGQIVSEWYADRYSEPVAAMSSTKAVMSVLIGQLVDAGLLTFGSRVTDLLPEWRGGYREDVTIEHILTHTSGFDRRTASESIGYAANKSAFALSLEPDRAPGTVFSYSNEAVQLLEPVAHAVTGESTEGYIQRKLFEPLGMNESALYAYGGSAWAYAEMQTTPRDLARLGLLMKQKGMWEGTRIVGADYVSKATSSSALEPRMGYLWWILDPKETVRGFYASGYLNTDVYVFEDYDVIVVRTQSPTSGYTGRNESGDYFRRAKPIFRAMVAGR